MRRYKTGIFYLKKIKTIFIIVCIFKSCNLKSLSHVLSHTVRTVNRMHKYVWHVQYIWRRWKSLASKRSENFESEPHGMPMFRAQITFPTSALSMTERQELVGCACWFPPHLIPSQSLKYFHYEKVCILHPRISSLALAVGAHAWDFRLHEHDLKLWSKVTFSGSVLA